MLGELNRAYFHRFSEMGDELFHFHFNEFHPNKLWHDHLRKDPI